MNERFIRNEMLLGAEAVSKLSMSHVAVFGLGGVGSWCAEGLARAGIGELTLVDADTVSISNINRQLPAVTSAVGLPKAEVMAARLRDINPDIKLRVIAKKYEAAVRGEFFTKRYDYIADAIDLVTNKLDLIITAQESETPIISALGTGNKLDPSMLEFADIYETYECRLARVMRRELRRRGVTRLDVVYSPEVPVKPAETEPPPPGRRSVPGSLVFVPASAGLLMASHIVNTLCQED